MTEKEAIERVKMILIEATEDEYAVSYVTYYDADTLNMAIKALDQVAELRELRKNLAEKEQVYANESNDTTMYFVGLANAYCTTNALIDEILGDIRR